MAQYPEHLLKTPKNAMYVVLACILISILAIVSISTKSWVNIYDKYDNSKLDSYDYISYASDKHAPPRVKLLLASNIMLIIVPALLIFTYVLLPKIVSLGALLLPAILGFISFIMIAAEDLHNKKALDELYISENEFWRYPRSKVGYSLAIFITTVVLTMLLCVFIYFY